VRRTPWRPGTAANLLSLRAYAAPQAVCQPEIVHNKECRQRWKFISKSHPPPFLLAALLPGR